MNDEPPEAYFVNFEYPRRDYFSWPKDRSFDQMRECSLISRAFLAKMGILCREGSRGLAIEMRM